MEKRYFILKKGYLNIDEDFFYFNDHGNWETCQVLEETEFPRVTFFNLSNKFIHTTYVVLVCIILSGLFFDRLNFSYSFLFFGVLFYFLNLNYKLKYFKIPLQKIERIEVRAEKLTMTFLNRSDKSIKHIVKLDDLGEVKDIQQYLRENFNQKLSIA